MGYWNATVPVLRCQGCGLKMWVFDAGKLKKQKQGEKCLLTEKQDVLLYGAYIIF